VRRHVLLVGLPGVGKSTVGRLVAEGLDAPLLDIDSILVRQMGMPIAQIFGMVGETRFRAMERDAVNTAQAREPAVIVPGAGWAAEPGQMAAAKPGSLIIYLKCSASTAARRTQDGDVRPLLVGADPIDAAASARPPAAGDPRAGFRRRTNNAGGLEGGITTGEPLVLRVAMKPISTLMSPLPTVDLVTGQAANAQSERSDVTAVPAMGVIAEALTAFVLADAMLEKFGGDSLAEMRRNFDGYVASLGARWAASCAMTSSQLPQSRLGMSMATGEPSVSPARTPESHSTWSRSIFIRAPRP